MSQNSNAEFAPLASLSVAVLGAAHIHCGDFIREMQKFPHLTVAGIWDKSPERAEKMARQLNCGAFKEQDSLLAQPHINALVIASETYEHSHIIEAALHYKIPLFVEKPLATDTTEAQRLAGLIDRAAIPFHTGHFNRNVPAFMHIKALIESGKLGEIYTLSWNKTHDGLALGWFDDEYAWMKDKEKAGYGGFGDLGLHCVDMFCWLLNSTPESVEATVAANDYYGHGLLHFANNMTAKFTRGWIPATPAFSFEITAEHGRVVLRFDESYIEIQGEKQPLDFTIRPDSGQGLVTYFSALQKGDHRSLISAQHATKTVEIMNQLYQSAASPRTIMTSAHAS